MLSEFILENKTFALQEKAQTWQQAVKKSVDLILCITAPDKEALNEKVIVEVMDLFDNENALKQLRSAQNERELKDVLNGGK